ncbi:MAG: hypothetical protein IKC65_03235 [Lentisphaeria bacterium]|nr:hypothetical protein [Lentisphaeria bacterium]
MKKFLFLLPVVTAGSLWAASPAFVFSFDKQATSDQKIPGASGGKARYALRPHFAAKGVSHADMLVPGLSGNALRVGNQKGKKQHDTVSFYLKDGIASKDQGGFSLWMKAVDWDHNNRKAHVFLRLINDAQESIVAVAQNNGGRYQMRLLFGTLKPGSTSTNISVFKTDWKMGEWHHLAATWQKNKLSFYVDGEFVGTRQISPVKGHYRLLRLGEKWNPEPGLTLIDEVHFFNTALSDADVNADYRQLAARAKGGRRDFELALGSKVPVLDGKVTPGEYAAGFSLMHEVKLRQTGYFAEYQPKCYLSYDSKYLYFAMVSNGNVKRTVSTHDGPVWEDDSVELYLTKSGTHKDIYHFIINSDNAVYDSQLQAGREMKKYNARGLKLKSANANGSWTIEGAIPWSSVDFSPATQDHFYLNFCRSYRGSGHGGFADDHSKKNVASAKQIRHCGICISNNTYAVADTYGKVFFRPGVPAFELLPIGQLTQGKVNSGLTVFGKEKDTVKASLTASGTKTFRFNNDIAVLPGKTALRKISGSCATEGVFNVDLSSKKHGSLLRAKMLYKKPNLLKFKSFIADPGSMQLIFRTEGGEDSGAVCNIRIQMKDWKSGKIVYDRTKQIKLVRGLINTRFDLKELPPGLFDLIYQFSDSKEKVFVDDYLYFAKPDGKAPWEGVKSGLGDIVPRPWTAPVARNNAFICWGRQYAMGGKGLVSSIISQKKELLARPVTLVLNGKALAFDAKLIKKGKSFADYRLTAKGAPVTVDVHAEFDGLLWFTAHVGKAGFKVNSLKLEYPVSRKYAHAFDDCTSIYEKVDFAKWNSKKIINNPVEKPFFWIGGPDTGIMGGIENFRGWYFKNKKNAAALLVDPKEAVVSLQMIDTPLEIKTPRKIEFYLQATPTRKRNIPGRKLNPVHSRITWHPTRFFEWKAPGIINDGYMQQFLTMEKTENIYWYHYFASKGSSPRFPWWGWYGADWNMFGDPEKSIQERPNPDRKVSDRGVWTWTCLNSKNFFDHKIDNIRHYLSVKKYNVRDIYFDLAWPYPCHNKVHGCTWTDEFGFTHHDQDMRALRDFHKRAYIMIQEKNPDTLMMGHIRYSRLPSDVFFDILTVGESYERQIAEKHSYYDVFTPEILRILYVYRSNEFNIQLGPQIYRTIQVYNTSKLKDYSSKDPEIDKAQRHYLAYVESHGFSRNIYMRRDGHEQQLFTLAYAKNKLGYTPHFHSYWDKQSGIRAEKEHPRFIYSAYSGNGKALVIALNDTDQPMKNALLIDSRKLSLPSAKGKEVFSGKEFSVSNGRIVFELPPRESRFILFEK